MDTKIADRATAGTPRWADGFPYVNGQLFSGSTEVPRFSKIARAYLLHIGHLDWTKINPDIFGSMIQAVADDEERGALGMHYTSVPNILKVLPLHGEDRDIFERLYAVRLDRIRAQADCRDLLAPLDAHGLLAAAGVSEDAAEFVDDADLLAELGVQPDAEGDITQLRHVRSREEIRAAEEIANKTLCADFDRFKPLFERMQSDLAAGVRETREFGRDPSVTAGDFFILGGQFVYVAELGETIRAPNGESDARLRAVYANGTESNLLRRSLQRALYKDEAGRRVTAPSAGPLFGHAPESDDLESGTIYVLRSKSDHPEVTAHRDLIHKIGVTGGAVETRIAQAATDATYLLAEVEIVASYKLFNINRTKLEALLHRVLAPARLDLTIEDRFGNPVHPREWYLVPLSVIDDVVAKVRDGSITGVRYDPATASLTTVEGGN